MGRKERHGRASILHSARELSAEAGPQKITIASVARHAGAPVGSIYHRYASRDEILAEVWLDLVEEFQGRFLSQLDVEGDATEAGLAAVRFTCSWVRAHPREARLMLLHRRSDFAADRWPETYQQRARALAADADRRLGRYATRLLGRSGKVELRRVQFILVDLPTAALKRDLEAGVGLSKDIEKLLLETCAAAFRQIGALTYRNSR
jgi:AcrR family transcriptional regulator